MKKHKDLIDTTIWNIADVSSNRCMSAKEIRASIRPKIENLVGQILKANPVENRVMPQGELLPCPFCGGNDCLWSDDGYPEVKCLTRSKNSEEVTAKWNKRVKL